jgi:hypothetical protein
MKIAYLVYWYTFICLSSVFLQFFWSRKSLSLLVSLLFCKESIFIPTFAWTLTGSCKKGIGSLLLNKNQVTCITKKVTVHGFKGSEVQRFKGCILITIRHFVNVLHGKTDRFHIPTNLEHGIWQLCGKTSAFYEDFGSSILSLSLTLNVEP